MIANMSGSILSPSGSPRSQVIPKSTTNEPASATAHHEGRPYDAEITFVDMQLARLLESLEKLNQPSAAVVVEEPSERVTVAPEMPALES